MPDPPSPIAADEDLILEAELHAFVSAVDLGNRALHMCYGDDIAAFEADAPGHARVADLARVFRIEAPEIIRCIELHIGAPPPISELSSQQFCIQLRDCV